jgi:hypothetical protein
MLPKSTMAEVTLRASPQVIFCGRPLAAPTLCVANLSTSLLLPAGVLLRLQQLVGVNALTYAQ